MCPAAAYTVGEIFDTCLRITTFLVSGMFAEIYLAEDSHSCRRFVVKAAKHDTFEQFRSHRGSRLSIYSEYVTLSALRHRNVAKAFAAVVLPKHIAICMEDVDGPTLLKHALGSACDERYMVFVLCGLTAALHYIHLISYAHRDV